MELNNEDKNQPIRKGVITKSKKEEFGNNNPGIENEKKEWESDSINDEEEETDQKGFDKLSR